MKVGELLSGASGDVGENEKLQEKKEGLALRTSIDPALALKLREEFTQLQQKDTDAVDPVVSGEGGTSQSRPPLNPFEEKGVRGTGVVEPAMRGKDGKRGKRAKQARKERTEGYVAAKEPPIPADGSEFVIGTFEKSLVVVFVVLVIVLGVVAVVVLSR
jgi:hypothetical protein